MSGGRRNGKLSGLGPVQYLSLLPNALPQGLVNHWPTWRTVFLKRLTEAELLSLQARRDYRINLRVISVRRG